MKWTVAIAAVLFSWVLLKFGPGVATVFEGLGTIGTGASAISTGILLFGCNLVLNVLGVISIVVGAATVAAGVNQVVCGAIGVNVMKETFHMSDGAYEALYLGANIASLVCVVTGRIAAGLKGIQCFIGGTLVATEDGLKPIENIEVGDKVLAYDETTGEQAYKKVVRLFRNETYEWYHIFVNDEEIVCTGGHPFYSTKYGKFITVKDLETDDKLLFSNGEYGIINRIAVEVLSEPQTTYNFEVEDYHTYYVGENEVLVHNKCRYYEAERTSKGIEKGREISKRQALDRLRKGKDVLTNSKSSAKALAKKVYGNSRVYSEIHMDLANPMTHFHDKNNHFYHVFFGDNYI